MIPKCSLNSAMALVMLASFTAHAGGPVVGPAQGPDAWPADLAPETARMAPALRPMIEEAMFRALDARHQQMLNGIAARRGAPKGQVVACFAPDTSAETMAAFNRAIFGFGDRYTDGPRWGSTASNPTTGLPGDPIIITYSFVPDGTVVPNGVGEGEGPSDLFARMNTIYDGNTAQWQNLYHSVFARWGELTGITYIYEPNDDGARLVDEPGQLGVRGDVRLAGKLIDGNSGILAYNYYPDSGDMVVDTVDNFFEGVGSNSLALRNVLSHEHGHGMGQPHVCPVQSTKLMEPFVSTAYDGPRHDDIRGAHSRYGDVNEPNGSSSLATPLGTVPTGSFRSFGAPPAPAIVNGSTLSIHGDGDEDWYSFVTTTAGLVTISASPVGTVYEDAPQACAGFSGSCCFGEFTDSAAVADLNVELFNSSGVLLASSNFAAVGLTETLRAAITAPGTYFAKVSEVGEAVESQLYSLGIGLASAPAVAMTLSSPVVTLALPSTSVPISVQVAAAGVPLNTVQVSLFARRGSIAAFTQTPLSNLGAGTFATTLNVAGCGEQWEYYIEANAGSASATLPANGGEGFYFTAVGAATTLATETFEVSPGWTVTGNATSGAWTHGEPLGTGAQTEIDHSSDPLGNCYFTGQGTNATSAGEADVDGGSTTLTSSAFSALGLINPTIAYWRWYDNSRGSAPNSDVFTVELSSNNGATWVLASTIGPSTQNTGGWVYHQMPLGPIAGITPTSTMKIRFTASDLGAGSLVEAAIDDFSVFGITCVNSCPSDWNHDDGVDGDDVIVFFGDWDAGNADFNNDGGTDGDDVIAFFGAWDNGC